MTRWLKITGAVLLSACFALPMSSCARWVDERGEPVTLGPDMSIPPGAHRVTTHYHLIDFVYARDPLSWLYLAAFGWPVLFLLHAHYRPAARLTRVLWFVEPLLLAGTLYSIAMIPIPFDEPDIGSDVGAAGAAVYFIGWAGQAFAKWQHRRRRPTTR